MFSYYSASDDPQTVSLLGSGIQLHEGSFQAYGPPPPNYIVERYWHQQKKKGKGNLGNDKTLRMRYKETSSPNAVFSYDHPLSSAVQNPVIHDEALLVRKKVMGLFDAPIRYKAGEMTWHYSSAFGALANALTAAGKKNKSGNPVTEADIQANFNAISQGEKDDRRNSVLYHPTDRDSMVWPDEPAVSMVARGYGCSVIILSPFVSHNGVGINRIYNRTNRPPIYARWSTGNQGLDVPIVLGCLPRQVTTTEPTFRAMWFSVKPKDLKAPPTWFTDLYAGKELSIIAKSIGFPAAELNAAVFLWSLVSLQRRVVLGTNLGNDDLACWLWQFGNHLVANCKGWKNPHPVPFEYDATKVSEHMGKFPGGRLTFERLSRLVLSPHTKYETVSTKQYAQIWDEAIDAQIIYKLNQTDTNWDDFTRKMDKARRPPL